MTKRRVTFDSTSYTVKSTKVKIPDLDAMDRLAALLWLMQNTYPKGVGIRTKPDPLAGLGGAIKVEVR